LDWNANIHQYRILLKNPDLAPHKAEEDLRSGSDDAEEKLLAILAEVLAVVKLSTMGYKNFRVFLASTVSTPDFEAEDAQANRTWIEVKNLRAPKDIVRSVVAAQWKRRAVANPTRYNFKAVLKYSHRGSLSSNAIKRLGSIIDVLPDTKNPIEEVLDGGVRIRGGK